MDGYQESAAEATSSHALLLSDRASTPRCVFQASTAEAHSYRRDGLAPSPGSISIANMKESRTSRAEARASRASPRRRKPYSETADNPTPAMTPSAPTKACDIGCRLTQRHAATTCRKSPEVP